MNLFLKWFLGSIGAVVGLFVLITIIGLIGVVSSGGFNEDVANDPSVITVAKFGENYPYVIDNLKLKCEDDAVWVEDSALNKYALNGLAFNKFQDRGDFKGYTSEISKPDPKIKGAKLSDSDILSIALTLCN